MKRRFRLTRSNDFKRVWRSGRSYAHPLLVLFVLAKHPCGMASETPGVRIGVAAGRTVGNAVLRNRAKRLVRAAMQGLLPGIIPGFDLVLVARQPLPCATLAQTTEALTMLLQRAGLFSPNHDS